MSVFRKNTLVIDFSVLPKRPDAGEVQRFLENKVKLKLADTTTIQFHNIRNCVYVETIDYETAFRYQQANHYKHTLTCNNKEFKIPVYVDSEAVTVRVHDLPTHTPHQTVVDFMGQYGVVTSIAREKWKHYFPGHYNGVRVLRMKINISIPSCVFIAGEPTLITYRNQPKTCHHCGKAAHPKQKCGKSPTAASNAITPTPPPPGTNDPQLNGDEDEFPPLGRGTQAASVGTEMQQSRNNNENSTPLVGGEDCDNDDDDDDGEGDSSGDEENGTDSADSNDFIEATNRKRRSKRELSQKTYEMKKMCLSKNSQNLDPNSNRFQALVEIDPICPSALEMEEYINRSNGKQRNKCTPSN